MSRRLGRLGCGVVGTGVLACLCAMVLFVAAFGGLLPRTASSAPGFSGRYCRAGPVSASAKGELSPEQRRNARIIVSVGKSMGIPEYGWVIAVATAMQESKLRNIHHGDRDSLGLFQQRPSQGWGTPQQIMNPRYAARQFYRHLRNVEGWQSMKLTVAAQRVQRSAFGRAYQQWARFARGVVTRVTDGGFTCIGPGTKASGRGPDGQWKPEQMLPMGLTPRTKRVMDLIERKFDEHNIGGFCPGGCTTGHVPGSDHYDGHAIDVMILPWHDPSRVAKGWRIVEWLVANHRRLAIDYVIYRKRIWTDDEGWHPYTHPSGVTSNPTLNHMDHIHVSVY